MEKKTVSYEEYLDKFGVLTYTFRGVSMLPMLRQGKDLITVEKKGAERLKKYDVPLYRRGKDYVLHRVVKVREKDYVILGDNCLNKEYGVTDSDIIGVLVSFKRNGKTISVDDPVYRIYARLRYFFYPLRAGYITLRGRAAAFFSKCPFLQKLWHFLRGDRAK